MVGPVENEAFAALYSRYQRRVFRFALQMSGSRDLAEEATQEVFLALLNGAGYDAARGAFLPFLLGVARNHVLRLLRRERPFVTLSEDADSLPLSAGVTAAVDISRKQSIAALHRAVLSLPEAYREVVVLCELQELDYAEAAQALGCAIGTVRSRLHRARALLLEKLTRRGGGGSNVHVLARSQA
jgi:RNA polymerase sigma-70 factor (ECF subfamily)